jgi:hypothetical protein
MEGIDSKKNKQFGLDSLLSWAVLRNRWERDGFELLARDSNGSYLGEYVSLLIVLYLDLMVIYL